MEQPPPQKNKLPVLNKVGTRTRFDADTEYVAYPTGDLSTITRIGEHEYETMVTKSYSNTILNPSTDRAWDMFNGRGGRVESHPENKHTLLMPMQVNGKCAANCGNCGYRASLHKGVVARPVSPANAERIYEKSLEVWRHLHPGQDLGMMGVSFVMAGGAGFNEYVTEVLDVIESKPDVSRVRLSTIAPKSQEKRNPFTNFLKAVKGSKERKSKVKWRLQVSIHSTNPKARLDYVNGAILGIEHERKLKVYSLEEIATAFRAFYEDTGRKGVLAFTCNEQTEIDPMVLIQAGLTPDITSISLRDTRVEDPTEQANLDPMSEDTFKRIYTRLQTSRNHEGKVVPPDDIVIMPSSESGGEQERHVGTTRETHDQVMDLLEG